MTMTAEVIPWLEYRQQNKWLDTVVWKLKSSQNSCTAGCRQKKKSLIRIGSLFPKAPFNLETDWKTKSRELPRSRLPCRQAVPYMDDIETGQMRSDDWKWGEGEAGQKRTDWRIRSAALISTVDGAGAGTDWIKFSTNSPAGTPWIQKKINST